MTVEDVKGWLESIRKCGSDFEALHSKEDALLRQVLGAIANGECPDPAGVAREALKSFEIPGRRLGA